MITYFLKNWIADIIRDVSKGLGLTKDNVSMRANDKVFEATITFDNGTEYVYYISSSENKNGQTIFIDRIDGEGDATKVCKTKSQIINFLTSDINTGLVAEATEILEQQGYRVVLNESIINETVDIAEEVRELLKNDGYDENEIENLMDYAAIDDMASLGVNARDIADQLIDNVYGNLKFESKMNEFVKDDIVNKIYDLAEEFGHGVNEQGNGYLIYNNNIAVENDEKFIDKLEKELGSTIGYDNDGDGNLFVWIEDLIESTQMNEDINNHDEPASKKQLWTLFCIYKKDFRNQGLTKGEASELIKKGASERPAKSSVKSLDSKICEHIETVLKPKLDKKMEDAFENQSIVGDADLEGNLIPGRKRYKFFGGGNGYAWIKYDKRNKKLGEVTDRYLDIYEDKYSDKYCKEYIRKFKEKEMCAVLSQDLDIQYTIKQAALDFAESIGINIDKAYVNGRLD